MTEPSSEKILRPQSEVQPFIDQLITDLRHCPHRRVFAGAWRRKAPLVDSIDVVLVTPYGTLADVDLPPSVDYHHKGEKVAIGRMFLDGSGLIHVTFWICTSDEFGGLLMFLTGPRELWEVQQKTAKKKGYRLTPVGLLEDGDQVDDGTEEGIYEILGFDWLTPEQRQSFAPKATDTIVRQVKSSKGDKFYTVKVRGTQARCQCQGFIHRHFCRHIREVQEELGIEGPVTANTGL